MMSRKIFFGLIAGICVFCISAVSFATMETEALEAYRKIFRRRYACNSPAEIETLYREVLTREGVAVMNSSGFQSQMNGQFPGFQDYAFSALKDKLFDINELVVGSIATRGSFVDIKYGRSGYPDFAGTATMTKEDGAWKMVSDSIEAHSLLPPKPKSLDKVIFSGG